MVYEPHPSFTPPPDPNISIWRYMDFTRFVSMLDSDGLHFARADRMSDPFEGIYPGGKRSGI